MRFSSQGVARPQTESDLIKLVCFEKKPRTLHKGWIQGKNLALDREIERLEHEGLECTNCICRQSCNYPDSNCLLTGF